MARPGTWKKGQSGNPKGRPPKSRALTELLDKAGSKTLEDVDGVRRSGKRVVPRLLWELATSGQTTLPDGRRLVVDDVSEMMAIWKFLYQHIDGPPKTELDIDHSGSVGLDLGDLEQVIARIYGDDGNDEGTE